MGQGECRHRLASVGAEKKKERMKFETRNPSKKTNSARTGLAAIIVLWRV